MNNNFILPKSKIEKGGDNMILIVTQKFDPHADFLIKKLIDQHLDFYRFNTDDYPVNMQILFSPNITTENKLIFGDRVVKIDEIRSIWYRRPLSANITPVVKNKFALEFAQGESNEFLKTLWRCLKEKCLWISHPEDIRNASHKMHQLILAEKIGFNIPDTLVVNNPEIVLSFYKKHKGDIVIKVLNRGYVDYNDGVFSLIYTNRILKNDLQKFTESIKISPCLFQEYIPKCVELRITIVGSNVFAAEIHSQNSQRTKDDWRHYDFEHTPHFTHNLPTNIENLCREIVKRYNLNFGTIDMIITPDNRYIFLELNPNGQWMWIEELTKLPISEALIAMLAESNL